MSKHGIRSWSEKLMKGRLPAPVYVAEFVGQVRPVRMSYWSDGTKPVSVADGRRSALQVLRVRDCKLVRGYVEFEGRKLPDVDVFAGVQVAAVAAELEEAAEQNRAAAVLPPPIVEPEIIEKPGPVAARAEPKAGVAARRKAAAAALAAAAVRNGETIVVPAALLAELELAFGLRAAA